jgi:RNA polymerase-binding transcription factor DksA
MPSTPITILNCFQMNKKTKSKSKTVSKNKAKKRTVSPKKTVTKKAKPTAKKVPAKKVVKAKAATKKAQAKVIHKVKPKATPKAAGKKNVKTKIKAKAPVKPAVKAKTPSVIKSNTTLNKESKKNIKPTPTQAKTEESKIDTPSKNTTTPNRPSVGRPIPVNRRPEPARAIISNSKPEVETGKNRYSDNELEEFRDIINKKLTNARKELTNLQAQMTAANEHGTDDTASTFKILEDGSDSLAKEEAGQLASRQKKFIEQLENALVRIENKTYGICRVTGKLIPKERLRAVPHTTQSIEAKLNQYRD